MRGFIAILGICAAAFVWLVQVCQAMAEAPAHFVVTRHVANADLQPFTATIGAFGNGSRLSQDSGFEPLVFRTMLQATSTAPNRIIAPALSLSDFDSWRSGALDGAEVEILRIENGTFRSVRQDRVASGGHHASGWIPTFRKTHVIAPERTHFDFAWSKFNRPGVPYYFAVAAVDRRGHLSPLSEHVEVMAPARLPKSKPKVENALVKGPKRPTGARISELEAPKGLQGQVTQKGVARLSWAPVAGAAGYVLYRSDVPPHQHKGAYLALEGNGPPIKAGDLVFLRTRFFDADRSARLTNRVWSARHPGRPFKNDLLGWPDDPKTGDWNLIRHAPDTPVDEPGETFLRAHLEAGQVSTIGHWNHAGLAQGWYPVLKPQQRYRLDVWMRGQATHKVTFELSGFYERGAARIKPISFSITPDWKRYSATFEIPAVHPHKTPGKMQLRLRGPAVIDIDNFRLFEDGTPFLAFLPTDVGRLEASGMSHLRTHNFIKTGNRTYDLAALTNPGGVSNIAGGNTLPQTLRAIDQVRMAPWLQIEPHLSRAEWLGLAEYLAAPAGEGLTWANKRAAQGDAPWVSRFDTILFEIGNETWNQLFAPWVFAPMTDAATGARYNAGTVYGLYQEYVLAILQDSPHWPELSQKLVPVLGGWARTDYGFDAARASVSTRMLTHAGYNGGWDEDAGPAHPDAKGLSTVLTHVLQTTKLRAARHAEATRETAAARGVPLFVGTYEAGPGYALNGLNKRRVTPEESAAQEQAMKSVAAGTATLDAFLARASEGQVVQNFFTYGSGEKWTSHARWHKGGQTYPSWDLLTFFNTVGLGDLLTVETLQAPTRDLPAGRRRAAVKDAPLVAAYATQSEDRLVVIVLSRRVPGQGTGDGHTPVIVDLPITEAGLLTRISQSGIWRDHNVDGQGSRLVRETLSIPDSLPRLEIPDLPPGETLIYIFDGVR